MSALRALGELVIVMLTGDASFRKVVAGIVLPVIGYGLLLALAFYWLLTDPKEGVR